MIDAKSTDLALADQAEGELVAGGEDLGALHPDGGQMVDVEETAVVDLVAGHAPVGQPVRLIGKHLEQFRTEARAIASLITCKSLHIVSRNPAHARSLADREPWLPVVWSALDDLPGDHGGWEVMVRALSVEPISEEEERWWAGHEKNAIMLDLNYGERAADSRALAHERGIRYEDGTELLIQQGAASFEFWTGKKPSLQAMREALREAG